MEQFNLNNYLRKCIVGQKRTGVNKQFVFIQGDYAIKGPYNKSRLDNVINRSKILSEWGSNISVLMIDQFTATDGTFIRFPNIMKSYNLESEVHQESFSDYKYNILKNPPVISMVDALKTKNTWVFPLLEDTILTLCYCYILNVGDCNLRNTLVDPNTKQFYVIDYDDNLGVAREDEVFYFNKAPAKAYDWYNNVKCHYNKVADRLKVLLNNEIVINNNLIEKVQKTIDLLQKYGIVNNKPSNVLPTIKPRLKLNIISNKPKIVVSTTPKKSIILPKSPPKIINDNEIEFFYDGDKELSNYYFAKSPCLFKTNDLEFKSSEHAYQYYKFCHEGADKDNLNIISNNPKIVVSTTPKKSIILPKSPPKIINDNGIGFFYDGDYKELSNYYCTKSSCLFKINDLEFKSSEHAYQYYKFFYEGADKDTLEYAELIRNSQTPNDSKLLGHQMIRSGFQSRMNENIKLYKDKAIRKDGFDDVKIDIMKYIIYHKFDQDIKCRNVLLSTGTNHLFENSKYDSFWGIGDDKNGSNHLGKLLMELRDQLKIKYPPINVDVNVDVDGYMNWKGIFGGSTTFSGIKLDIAKSALQKYIRRNMTEKALLIAFELYRFNEIPEAKAAVTNLYNRLAIIANEDIGPANLPLVLEVTELIQNKNRDVRILYQIVKLLSDSKKSRFPSHCWRAYANPDGRKIAIESGLPVDVAFTSDDLSFITENNNCDLFVESDPEEIKSYLLTFWLRLINKDFNAFTWCYFYLEASKNITLKSKRKKFIIGNARCSTGKSDILLWKVLSKFIDVETHDILVEAYYNHTENRPFLQLAVMVGLYNIKYEKINIILDPADNDDIDMMLNGRYQMMKIDDFVIDKHTKDGRSNGMDAKEFVLDGALVIPEDMSYHNELLVKIYSTR